MTLLILSFIAGVLTVAAPCTLTLLPVIVGGSLARSEDDKNSRHNLIRPIIVTASLAVSLIVFTLLLKYSTSLLGVPAMVWQVLAGVIITLLGINFIFPDIWEKISLKFNLTGSSNQWLGKAYQKDGYLGDFLTGAALGPVFSGCSPTFAFIVAAILPISFAEGLVYLVAYAVGLAGMLLVVAYLGQGIVQNLGWLSDPNGAFRRIVGILFIVVGLSIATGFDKKAETYIIEKGWYSPIQNLEQNLR